MTGTLYFVATPIGNLSDITLRAKAVLDEVSIVACEDTRVAGKLLKAYDLSKRLLSVHEHSNQSRLDEIVRELKNGKSVAFISDAGTPALNDPGGKLAALAYSEGIPISPIPGVSALTAAISVCGFPMDDFHYSGFVPSKKGRAGFFKHVAESTHAEIFFESTHRIKKTLESLQSALEPTRPIFVGRELTKLHETLYRGSVDDVLKKLEDTSSRGEFTIIVAPKNFTIK